MIDKEIKLKTLRLHNDKGNELIVAVDKISMVSIGDKDVTHVWFDGGFSVKVLEKYITVSMWLENALNGEGFEG